MMARGEPVSSHCAPRRASAVLGSAPPLRKAPFWSGMVWFTGIMLSTLCVLLFARRLAGGFQTPLAAGTQGVVAAAAVAVAALFRCRRGGIVDSPLHLLLPAFPLLLFIASVTHATAAPIAAVAVWVSAAAAEGFWAWRAWRLAARRTRTGGAAAATERAGRDGNGHMDPAAEETGLPDGVTQQVTRAREPEQAEVVHGLFRAEFAPRQRTANLHVAFCPPLNARPEVTVLQVDGAPASLTVGQVATFGVRVEIRLQSVPTAAADVVVELHAVSEDSSEASREDT